MITKLRNFKPNAAQIDAAEAVLLAMAFLETVRPVVLGYQRRILEAHQFHLDPMWVDEYQMEDEVILEPDHAYLLSKEDSAVYYSEQKQARDAAGLKVERDDFCPLLVAENMLLSSQHALIVAMEPVTGITLDKIFCAPHCLDRLREYNDLLVRLMSNFVDKNLAKRLAA